MIPFFFPIYLIISAKRSIQPIIFSHFVLRLGRVEIWAKEIRRIMKLGRRFLWVLLLAELAGCQNPMQNAEFKNLQAQTQELAAPTTKDSSADAFFSHTSTVSAASANPIQLTAYQDKEKLKKEPK